MSILLNVSDAADIPAGRTNAYGSSLDRMQQKLEAARRSLAKAESDFRKASARQESIRAAAVGRAIWSLIKDDRLDPEVIALIRNALDASTSVTSALAGTPFEKKPNCL
jgi:phosphoenolpyruvate-protein kinase (PTS system EI component)